MTLPAQTVRPSAPSRWTVVFWLSLVLSLWTGLLGAPSLAVAQQGFSNAELDKIARRIWQNESAGKVSGLTAWNVGENFASLGIGHFIWYPSGETGPFEESFPALLIYLKRRGVEIPRWLENQRGCPWPNRQAFERAQDTPRMRELRSFLQTTQREQVLFIVDRLERTLPRYRTAAGRDGARVVTQIQALRQTPAGTFALIDYINFKGDGLNPRERYQGEGWGLLQVLLAMDHPVSPEEAPAAFARASQNVLRRRIELSPPARGERRWLQGWMNRCARYAQW